MVKKMIRVPPTRKVPRDICRTGHLWRRTVAQGHPWSKYYLARHEMAGDFAKCSFSIARADVERYVMSFAALDLDPDAERRTNELLALFAKYQEVAWKAWRLQPFR